MWTYNETCYPDFMYHHGIRGQRWGRRRYQDMEGHYTAEGRERYGIGDGMPYHNLNYKPGQSPARSRADAMMTRRSTPLSAADRMRIKRKERMAAIEQDNLDRDAKRTRLLDSPVARREKVVRSGHGTASILVGTVLKSIGSKMVYDIAGNALSKHGMEEIGSLMKLYGNITAGAIALNGALDASARIF